MDNRNFFEEINNYMKDITQLYTKEHCILFGTDVNLIKRFLTEQPNYINDNTNIKDILMATSIFNGSVDVFDYYVSMNIFDVSTRMDSESNFPLDHAISLSVLPFVERIIYDSTFIPYTKDNDIYPTPLFTAPRFCNNVNIVNLVIPFYDPNITNMYQESALIVALSTYAPVDICLALCDATSNINCRSIYNKTALGVAQNHPEAPLLLPRLLERGAEQ